MTVQAPETFENTAILADNLCTRVQGAHAQYSKISCLSE